jgi:Na+-transporting methylmalonyl-CoA/oxaloacetate decarboxylase gamma subunit
MKKTLFEYLLVILLLSPLLFINIRDSHDWGDDFAGYLRQAKNISEGKPFYQSKFEFYDYNPVYSPPYYSYGFPVLLSPVVKVFGLDFKVLDRYMSLWVLAWALLIFGYLRRYFSLFASVSFILLFFLNPFFFDFKTNVISDIPFAFFFLLSLLLYIDRKDKPIYYHVLAGLVLAFTIGIRGVGVVIPLVILLDLFIQCISFLLKNISKEDIKAELRDTLFILFSAVAFIIVLNNVIFPTPANLTQHFIGLFRYEHYSDMILKNLDVYTTEFNNLFHHDVGRYSFAIQYTSAFMLVLLVIGFINTLLSRHRFEMMVLITFCLVVVLFPYSNQGFRYLLPILPILMLCIIRGAGSIQTTPEYNKTFLAALFVIFILLQYKKEVRMMRDNQASPIWPGPFTEDSRKAIDHIKSAIPDGALIASLKPRAIELFTDHRTCVLPKGSDIPDIANKLIVAKPDYLLCIKDLSTRVDSVAHYRKDSLIWENNACRLYLCTDHQK